MAERNYKFADDNINISPLALGNAMKNAEYVYTSTFHGCIFSIINKKKSVYCLRSSKVHFLLETFQLENRICNEHTDYAVFCDMMEKEMDSRQIEDTIAGERARSLMWLRNQGI